MAHFNNVEAKFVKEFNMEEKLINFLHSVGFNNATILVFGMMGYCDMEKLCKLWTRQCLKTMLNQIHNTDSESHLWRYLNSSKRATFLGPGITILDRFQFNDATEKAFNQLMEAIKKEKKKTLRTLPVGTDAAEHATDQNE